MWKYDNRIPSDIIHHTVKSAALSLNFCVHCIYLIPGSWVVLVHKIILKINCDLRNVQKHIFETWRRGLQWINQCPGLVAGVSLSTL